MKGLNWVNFALGIWLITAAFTLSAGGGSVMTEEFVLGVITAVFAWHAARRRRNAALSWIVAAAGLWTCVGAALSVVSYFGFAASRTNDIVVGIIVAVLGTTAALYRESPIRTHAHDNYYHKA
ncbi:MAG TPA: hypothetical protein VIC33_03515 [Vicinamibacterales bacterium]